MDDLQEEECFAQRVFLSVRATLAPKVEPNLDLSMRSAKGLESPCALTRSPRSRWRALLPRFPRVPPAPFEHHGADDWEVSESDFGQPPIKWPLQTTSDF
jgi:hypothetical protein